MKLAKSQLREIIREEIQKVSENVNMDKLKSIVKDYVNLRKAIDDVNYKDTPHTHSAMKKLEIKLVQMSKNKEYKDNLLKLLPHTYQNFLK